MKEVFLEDDFIYILTSYFRIVYSIIHFRVKDRTDR